MHCHTSSCFDFNPVAINLGREAIINNRLASVAVCSCLILAMTLINFVLLFPAVFLPFHRHIQDCHCVSCMYHTWSYLVLFFIASRNQRQDAAIFYISATSFCLCSCPHERHYFHIEKHSTCSWSIPLIASSRHPFFCLAVSDSHFMYSHCVVKLFSILGYMLLGAFPLCLNDMFRVLVSLRFRLILIPYNYAVSVPSC